jgi:hypothetical protein
MTPRLPTPDRRRRSALRSVLATALALLLLAPAAAQSLPQLLPRDAALAVGLVDLASQTDKLQPFLDEAERLGLLESLGAAVPAEATEELGEDGTPDLPDAFEGLEILDLLGREAWIAVTASPFQPVPAVTMIARVSGAAQDAFATAIAEAADRPGTERLAEGEAPFYTWVPPSDGGDAGVTGPDLPVAYAQAGDVVVVSTDPETVRFVLRARAGGGEPTLADSELYTALRGLGDGHVLGMLDLEPLLAGLEPLAQANGAGALLTRIRAALTTAGPTVGLLRADDDGLRSLGLRLPRADGPDPALYGLLTRGEAPGAEVLAFAPEGTLTVAAGGLDLAGWWAWLDDVAASAAELGVPSATEALQMVGVDVNAVLLDWAGDAWAQVQTAPPAPGAAGASDVPLLGETALLVATRDDAAARQGLTTLFQTLGATAAGFMSPSGEAMVAPQTVQVAGVDVVRLPLSDTLVLDAAVVDGWAVLTGSADATEAVLTARASGSAGPDALADVVRAFPDGALSWTASDAGRSTGGSTGALVSQLQMLAGLGGAGTLDFDAVDDASEAVTAFAEFLAERIGTSRSVTTFDGGVLRNEGRTEVSW